MTNKNREPLGHFSLKSFSFITFDADSDINCIDPQNILNLNVPMCAILFITTIAIMFYET